MKTINIFTLFAIFFIAVGINAQEPLSQDVRVVREFDPTVSDAMKINSMPDREDTLEINPQFNYRVVGQPLSGTPQVESLSAARLAGQRKGELYPSYVRAGMGNYETLFGDIFYNITRNEKFAFALALGQESSWGDIELEDGTSSDAPLHKTNGGLYLRHFFDDKTLEFDMDFNRRAYEYYGLHTIDAAEGSTVFYETEDGSLTRGSALIPDRKQRQTAFDVHLGLLGQQSDVDDTRYHLGLDYGAFDNYTGVGENRFSLWGNVKLPFGGLALHMDGDVSYNQVNAPKGENEMPALLTFEEREQIYVTLNPKMVIPGEKLSVEVGVNVTGEFSGTEEFFLSPHVLGDLTIAEGIVSTFLGMTGEVRPGFYRDMMEENPYLSPDVLVETAHSNIRGFAGVKGNFSSATSFTARLDYEFIENEHFYVNRFFGQNATSNYGMSNLFDVAYDDVTLLTLSGELLVRPVRELDIVLKGAYYGWEMDVLAQAWHKPEMEIGLRAGYQFNEELRLDAAFNLYGDRKAYNPNEVNGVKMLKSVPDFNLGGNYQLNKRMHFFARIQNIFAAKYYQWSGYPMQGINFRVGAGYSF
ncbi:TonB-dependent receptor [Marinilabilia salmonicolor]|uniref:TonB-dependent receptor n=1 Tax=Marinilabilia salmonicolor TaxID=989 RepID=UPI00029AD0E3|nr:TonB-dependent receptor [Marinilabilia salmonicolor]